MWFYKTDNGTFCVRYFREGYGLFINDDCLSWHRDAESAAKAVADGRTGHAPWDTMETVERPKNLSQWLTLEEVQPGRTMLAHDPIVVPIDCGCGHRIQESVSRIRTIGKFRCPNCKEEIRISGDAFREIMEKVRKEYPQGYIKGVMSGSGS